MKMHKFVMIFLLVVGVGQANASDRTNPKIIYDKINELQSELEIVLLMPLENVDENRFQTRVADIKRLTNEIVELKSQVVTNDKFSEMAKVPFLSDLNKGEQLKKSLAGSSSDPSLSSGEALGHLFQVSTIASNPQLQPFLNQNPEGFTEGAVGVARLRTKYPDPSLVNDYKQYVKDRAAIRVGSMLAADHSRASYKMTWRQGVERFNALLKSSGQSELFIVSRGSEFRDLLLEVLLYSDALSQTPPEDKETIELLTKAIHISTRDFVMKSYGILSFTKLRAKEAVTILNGQVSQMKSPVVSKIVGKAVGDVSASDIMNQNMGAWAKRNYKVDFALFYILPVVASNVGALAYSSWHPGNTGEHFLVGNAIALVLAVENYFRGKGELTTYVNNSSQLRECRNVLKDF